MLNWDDLQLFLAVANNGSLSGAAKHLGLSQPTVGRRLDALEAGLGSTLFVRTAKGLSLTETGTDILQSAERMAEEAGHIQRLAAGRDRELSGPVTITTVEGLSTIWLTPTLADFNKKHPDVEFVVRVENDTADLINREADIALRLFRPTQNSLIAKKLITISVGLFASQDYLDRSEPITCLEDLRRHKFVTQQQGAIISSEAGGYRDHVADYYGEPAFRSESMTTRISAVRAGFGISPIALGWAQDFPDLVRILPDFLAGEVDLWLASHTEVKKSARIRAVWDHLCDSITEDQRRLLEGQNAQEMTRRMANLSI